jgi:serine/threonine-protein kinase
MNANAVDRLNAALRDRYTIEREIGAGGMATVYLAHDLRHDRRVALKVLKPEVAAVRGAVRFVQEIKTTAALQHPHILPLYDSGTADGFLFYVMPFIDGETLRRKLDRETQLAVDESVRIATHVADALDYAHRRGVIHRDIKPENILLHEGRPIVADFGIALAVSAAAGGRMTETGLSLGTPYYMSPEQATAEKEITAKSDVYSLASVLYEMLAGQPPHSGGSAQQILMKILTETAAPVTTHRKSVPPHVGAAIAQALEKLPADRFESARAFADALSNPAFAARPHAAPAAAATTAPRTWNPVTVGMTALAGVLALLLVANLASGRAEVIGEDGVIRFTLTSDPSLRIFTTSTRPFAVSPDGRTIVFRAATDSLGPHLWVRSVDDPVARMLEGTLDGMNPAVSPDGRTVAFVGQNRELRAVPLDGGPVRQVASLESISAALDWSSSDEILIEAISPEAGIQRVSVNGGSPEILIPLDSVAGEQSQRRPFLLRDAGIVVYGSTRTGEDVVKLSLYRLEDRRRVHLDVEGIGALAFVDEHLIYSGASGELRAVRLDVREMQVEGTAIELPPRVFSGPTGTAVALSEGGSLVYRSASAVSDARLELVDTTGTVTRTLPGTFGVLGTPRFSPDGRRVVLGIGTDGVFGRRQGVAFSDLWVIDVGSGEPTRLTTGADATAPSWFADGERVLYAGEGLSSVPVGGGARSVLLELGAPLFNPTAMPDGNSVVLTMSRVAGGALLRAWIDGSNRVDTLVSQQAHGIRPFDPRVSPDGNWVAFFERSSSDVWVRSLTGTAMLQVSVKGTEGNPVAWSRDSKSLYYANTEGLHVIELQTAPSLGVIRRRLIGRFPPVTDYDLSPDGRTFLVVTPVRSTSDVVVAVNWLDDARRAWSGAAETP